MQIAGWSVVTKDMEVDGQIVRSRKRVPMILAEDPYTPDIDVLVKVMGRAALARVTVGLRQAVCGRQGAGIVRSKRVTPRSIPGFREFERNAVLAAFSQI